MSKPKETTMFLQPQSHRASASPMLSIIITSLLSKIKEELINFDPPVLQVTAVLTDGKLEAGTDDAKSVNAVAIVGVDLDQKGMQMPQRYGAASSYGKKYALGNLFLIDDTQDADATNTHGKAKTAITNSQWDKAKKYVKSGGKVDAIKSKYSLTQAQETELQSL